MHSPLWFFKEECFASDQVYDTCVFRLEANGNLNERCIVMQL